MPKITPEEIRELLNEVDLSGKHVQRRLNISLGWFNKMMLGEFQNPDPKRMSLIKGYLTHVKRMQREYEKHTC